jgi:hypothetical protein
LQLARCKGLNKAEVLEYYDLSRKELTDFSMLHKQVMFIMLTKVGFVYNNKPSNKASDEKGAKNVMKRTCVR